MKDYEKNIVCYIRRKWFWKTLEKLGDSVPVDTEMIEGKLLNGNPSKAQLVSWIESLKL